MSAIKVEFRGRRQSRWDNVVTKYRKGPQESTAQDRNCKRR